MNKLQACYDKIAIIMGSDIESYSSVELVERGGFGNLMKLR